MTRATLTLALLLAPTLASAKWPGPGPSVLTLIRPFHGETDVPINTRIWLDDESAREPSTYATPREPRLFGPAGEVIPLGEPTTLVAPGGKLRVYTPPTLLPDATHELRNCDIDDCSHLLATFTTAAAPDSTPPAAPEIHDARAYFNYLLLVDADFADDILVIGNSDATADPLASHTIVAAATRANPLDLATDDLPSYTLRFAAYDLAGNFSGWTPTHDVYDHQGCRTTSTPTPWYLLLPLLLRRRKP